MEDSIKRNDCRKIVCDLFDARKKGNIINVYCECSDWWNLLQRTWCKLNEYNVTGMKENPTSFICIGMYVHFKAIIMEPILVKSNCVKMYYGWICEPDFELTTYYEYVLSKLKVCSKLNVQDCYKIWKNHPKKYRDDFVSSWKIWFNSTARRNDLINIEERKKRHKQDDYFLISNLPQERAKFNEKNMNQVK